MLLTPEEIEAIHQEETERLEAEVAKREQEAQPTGSTPRMEDPEGLALARNQEARRLRKTIEEDFWSQRGFQRYVTHHGKVLWLTPEQIKERRARKSQRRKTQRSNPNFALRERLQRVALYLAILALGVLLGLQLVR